MPYGITQYYLPPGRGDIPACVVAVWWPGLQSAQDNHLLACNFAKYSLILETFLQSQQ